MLPPSKLIQREFVGGPRDGKKGMFLATALTWWTVDGMYHLRAGKMYFKQLRPSDWNQRKWRPKWDGWHP